MAAERQLRALLLVLLTMRLASGAKHANTERDALREFRAGVSDPSGALRSWNTTAHFCRWAGVSCTHGHVTLLDVSQFNLTGTISPAIGNLTYLEILSLNRNRLSGRIPGSVGRLRRLQYLGLCDNGGINGEIPESLRNCTCLRAVYLNGNNLEGAIPDWFGTLANLTFLYLSSNSLSGEIPRSFGNLSNLMTLSLEQNYNLQGTIPAGLSHLPLLQEFTVYENRFHGDIPAGFFNLSSLQRLDLANNAFHGLLPPDAGARVPSLQYLLLGGNNLTGPIPASLADASSLQYLSLANNSFTGKVPPEIGTLCPCTLELSGNELTATDDDEGWEFLRHLTNCSSLETLALDGNKFSGTLPTSIGNLSRNLQSLFLGNNRISGSIPPGIGNLVALQQLRFDSNLLAGEIPEGIGKLKNLTELWLSGNKLSGPVPSSVGNLTQLLHLVLSNNMLSGSIPPTLASLQHLDHLNLSSNTLTGHVPKEIFNLPSLSSAVDLSDNQLDGPLPREVSRLANLAHLALSRNRFFGEIPKELENCQSLEYLDLDSNLFGGSIPPSLIKLKGLRRLNLTSNKLSGSIPPELGQMSGLQELYLSRNDLTGTIPEELENVSSLIELDLAHNHLDGGVPLRGVFSNMTGFKIAGNGELCGGVPQLRLPRCPVARDTRRTRLPLHIVVPVLSVALFLAILLTVFRCYRRNSEQAKAAVPDILDDKNYHQRISYAELARATYGFADTNMIGAGKFGSVYLGILPLQVKDASAPENVPVAVKVFDLRQVGATKTFLSECEALRNIRHRNLIRIITCCASVDAKGDDFRALVFEFMPNYSLDRWLHPKSEELDRNANSLSAVQRLNIAVDIADATEYLHNSCSPPIIHCDLKPSNVLLGEDMTALIGDFGLAKLLVEPGSHDDEAVNTESTIGIRGTIGYVAPEYGTTGKVSTQGDVYSFGVTLLEMFTGRSPTGGAFEDGLTLPEFVVAAFPDRIDQVIDPALLPAAVNGLDGEMPCGSSARVSVHDCLVSAVRIGLSCTRGAPFERPRMKDVAAELRVIRDACVRSGG